VTDVLVVVGRTPNPDILQRFVSEMKQLDVRVHLVGTFAVRDIGADWGLRTVQRVATSGDNLDWRTRGRALHAHPHERFWAYVNGDDKVRRLAGAADVIVAVDPKSYYSCWQLARLNPSAHACAGFGAAQRLVKALGDGTAPPVSAAAPGSEGPEPGQMSSGALLLGHEKVLGSRIGSAVARRVPLLPLPRRTRVDLTRSVTAGLFGVRKARAALATAAAVAQRLTDTGERADLLRTATRRALTQGFTPDTLLTSAKADLAHADRLLAAGDPAGAAEYVDHALNTAFHRVVHIDQRSGPLKGRAEEFARLVSASAAAAAATAPRGRERPPAEPAPGQPRRLLMVTDRDDPFAAPVREHYATRSDVELRFLDVADYPGLRRLAHARSRLLAHRLGGDGHYGFTAEQYLRPHLDWADTVFIDRCAAAAALFTSVDPGTARVVVRLHSSEAFSYWPQLADFSRVDELVFVAEHIRELALRSVPGLTGAQAPRTHVIAGGVDLAGFGLPKNPGARFTVGVVGIGQVAKDPRWALDVIRELRGRDDRYRLVMIGGDIDTKTSTAAASYQRAFLRELKPLVEAGAVELRGATDDLPGSLRDVGVVLSASVREGRHVEVMEAAAGGAVPVVRDWPFFAGRKYGASTLYPADWVVSTPQAAADRILAVTSDEQTWVESGRESEKHALACWDWTAVRTDLDRVLGIA
jgi:glycosyltransferase involved in cell wall biosynthesis